jgi:periplasmic protein TonB
MRKGKRFTTGFFGSVIFHILILLFFGISLCLYNAHVPQVSDKIVEVSLVSGGGGQPAGGQITVAQNALKEHAKPVQAIRPDDIVEHKEDAKEQIMPAVQERDAQQSQNTVNSTGTANANGSGNGNGSGGSGSGSGGGDGNGQGTGQGDNTGAGEPVQPPRLISRVQPDYPASARQNSVEGTTSVRLLVSASGDVESVSVSNSSGSGALDSAAVDAAYQWGFVPAKDEHGRAVRCYVSLPITFRLR